MGLANGGPASPPKPFKALQFKFLTLALRFRCGRRLTDCMYSPPSLSLSLNLLSLLPDLDRQFDPLLGDDLLQGNDLKQRSVLQLPVLICFEGTTVRVEFGDVTTTVDPSGEHVIGRVFPHTVGEPLAHFLRATAKVTDAQIITDHPPIRIYMLLDISCGGRREVLCDQLRSTVRGVLASSSSRNFTSTEPVI